MIKKIKKIKEQDELFPELNQPIKLGFFQKKGTIIAFVFSAMWLLFVVDYLYSSGWWGRRGDLSPAEFIGGIMGLLLPVVIAWLVSAYFDRSEQLDYEASTLKAYLNELVYPSAEGAVYTKTLTDALRAQIKEFRSVFNEVNEQTQSVRNDLKEWIADLSKVIHYVDTETVGSVKEMAKHINNLAEVTEIANQQANRASALFAEQAELLSKVSDRVAENVAELGSTVAMNLEDLKNTAHAIENVNERSEKAIQNSESVSGMLQEQAKRIEMAVQGYEAGAKQQNARLFGNLEKVLSVFRAQGDILDQEVEKTTNRLRVAEALFLEKTNSMFQSSDDAIFRLTEAAALFDRKAQNVTNIVSETRDELVTVSGLFDVEPKKATKTESKEDLLVQAQVILDRLKTFAIDIAHLWTPKQEEEMWKLYHAGDRAVFMRQVAKALTAAKAQRVKELYKSNKVFRVAVSRYMAEFEGLTQLAAQESDNNLLVGILVGSDVGKLYMVLADILKKEE